MAGPKTKAPDPETTSSSNGRQCPSFAGNTRMLITHRIGAEVCMQRQRENYHKCHRCVLRGKPADFAAEDLPASSRDTNGVVRRSPV